MSDQFSEIYELRKERVIVVKDPGLWKGITSVTKDMRLDDFWSNAISNYIGGLLVVVTAALVTWLISIHSLKISVEIRRETDKNPFFPDITFILESRESRLFIFNEEVGSSQRFSKNPKTVLFGKNIEIRYFLKPIYLKVKKYKNIPILFTSIVRIDSDGSINKLSLRAMILYLIKDNKVRSNNKEIAKDFEKLLKFRPDCNNFILRFTNPEGLRDPAIALWEDSDEMNTIAPFSSDWHNAFFTYTSLLSFLDIDRNALKSQEETHQDYIAIKLNREKVINFISLVLKNKSLKRIKKPKHFYQLFRPDRDYPEEENTVIGFPTTSQKSIQLKSWSSNLSAVLSFDSKKHDSDRSGILITKKTKNKDNYYIFINRDDYLVIYGTINRIRYSKISENNFRALENLLLTWDKW